MTPLFYKGPDGEKECYIRSVSEETIRILKERAAEEPRLSLSDQWIVTLEETGREIYTTLDDIEVRDELSRDEESDPKK